MMLRPSSGSNATQPTPVFFSRGVPCSLPGLIRLYAWRRTVHSSHEWFPAQFGSWRLSMNCSLQLRATGNTVNLRLTGTATINSAFFSRSLVRLPASASLCHGYGLPPGVRQLFPLIDFLLLEGRLHFRNSVSFKNSSMLPNINKFVNFSV
eukprot:Gb_38282 [translate_table: standard]